MHKSEKLEKVSVRLLKVTGNKDADGNFVKLELNKFEAESSSWGTVRVIG